MRNYRVQTTRTLKQLTLTTPERLPAFAVTGLEGSVLCAPMRARTETVFEAWALSVPGESRAKIGLMFWLNFEPIPKVTKSQKRRLLSEMCMPNTTDHSPASPTEFGKAQVK